MTESAVKMGSMVEEWKGGVAKSITFCVTEDCNLACKYCYMTGKNAKNKMDFETAKAAVDYILNNKEIFQEPSVAWEFIGGEPFLEIELIDKICDYIKYQMYVLDHSWFNSYRFSFSSNGVLYHLPAVQKFIEKNKTHVSIGLSVDGNKIKHDLQRVKPNGSGSYDDVVKNVPLWLEQCKGSASTKATFAHDDLPFLKDSIISLWDIGIDIVSANVVFEDVWHDGDDDIFESQLKELADYVIDNKLWDTYSVRFFDPSIGFPQSEEEKSRNYCGSGKMLAIDTKGNLFPCVRFYDMSLNNRKPKDFGNVYEGLNQDMLRPFAGLDVKRQSPLECLNCEVASGCSWCTGYNYDAADTDTIFQRATYICKMHKANVRATEYFWSRFSEVTGQVSDRELTKKDRLNFDRSNSVKFLQFITDDRVSPHCTYRNKNNTNNVMNTETIQRGLEFADENGYQPIFLTNAKSELAPFIENNITIFSSKENCKSNFGITVYDNSADDDFDLFSGNCILLIDRENVDNINKFVRKIIEKNDRVNIILEDISIWSNGDINRYEQQLDELINLLEDKYQNDNPVEINVLTDILNSSSMGNCDAGENTFSLAPNGKIYICPAFYFDNPDDCIGDLEEGIRIKNGNLLSLENSFLCSKCDTFHCRRCKYDNKRLTGEYNTPSKIQCVISHIEREKSIELQSRLGDKEIFTNKPNLLDYRDPFEKIKN